MVPRPSRGDPAAAVRWTGPIDTASSTVYKVYMTEPAMQEATFLILTALALGLACVVLVFTPASCRYYRPPAAAAQP